MEYNFSLMKNIKSNNSSSINTIKNKTQQDTEAITMAYYINPASSLSIVVLNSRINLYNQGSMESESDNLEQRKGIITSSCSMVERHKDSDYKIPCSEVDSTSKASDKSLKFA